MPSCFGYSNVRHPQSQKLNIVAAPFLFVLNLICGGLEWPGLCLLHNTVFRDPGCQRQYNL